MTQTPRDTQRLVDHGFQSGTDAPANSTTPDAMCSAPGSHQTPLGPGVVANLPADDSVGSTWAFRTSARLSPPFAVPRPDRRGVRILRTPLDPDRPERQHQLFIGPAPSRSGCRTVHQLSRCWPERAGLAAIAPLPCRGAAPAKRAGHVPVFATHAIHGAQYRTPRRRCGVNASHLLACCCTTTRHNVSAGTIQLVGHTTSVVAPEHRAGRVAPGSCSSAACSRVLRHPLISPERWLR